MHTAKDPKFKAHLNRNEFLGPAWVIWQDPASKSQKQSRGVVKQVVRQTREQILAPGLGQKLKPVFQQYWFISSDLLYQVPRPHHMTEFSL